MKNIESKEGALIRPDGLPHRYELKALLGRGAFGKVYLALDSELNINVAVKISPFDGGSTSNDDTRRRAKREIIASGRISHPNAVKIYDGGLLKYYAYIVMEVIEGGSLEELIAEGPFAPGRAIKVAILLAEALSHLHGHDIVHRDIKPANILMVNPNQPKLMDFNLVRVVDQTAVTETGALIGTPTYLAPELLKGVAADQRVDIYGLGLVLWSMLTGKKPFDECQDFSQVVAAKLDKNFIKPSSIVPGLSAEMDGLVGKAVAINPDHRYQSAKAFARACKKLLEFEKNSSISSTENSTFYNTGETSAVTPSVKKSSPSIVGAAFFLLLLCSVFFFVFKPGKRTDSTTNQVRFAVPLIEDTRQGTKVTWRCSTSISSPMATFYSKGGNEQKLSVEVSLGRNYSTLVPVSSRLKEDLEVLLKGVTKEGKKIESKQVALPRVNLDEFHSLANRLKVLRKLANLPRLLQEVGERTELAKVVINNRIGLFASSALSKEEKLQLYTSLLAMRRIDIYLMSRNELPLYEVGKNLGLVEHAIFNKKPFSSWDSWPSDYYLWQPPASKRYFLPRPPKTSGNRIDFLTNVATTKPRATIKAKLSSSFYAACKEGRAILFLSLKMPSPHIMMTVTCNSNFPIIFWGKWRMTNGTRQIHLAEIPLEYLHPGTNEILVEVSPTTPKVILEPTVLEAISFIAGSFAKNHEGFSENDCRRLTIPEGARPLEVLSR